MRLMEDAGHEAVGQALLIAVVGCGALGAAALGSLIIGNLEYLIATWNAFS
jgi:hypothetical protein